VRQLSHVLKVFLIDQSGYVREIYTSTFLHPQTIMGDIQTLLMEEGGPGSASLTAAPRAAPP
jgi:hypothetical protein